MFDFLIEGFGVALTPLNLGLALLGALLGTLFGALPGIGPINGIAILMPLAYTLGLPAESSLILLAAVYTGAEYGGRMSSILLNVPGDAGAVMTTLDGYPLAQRGLAGPALGLSAVSSFIGATIAILGLTLFAPLLAKAISRIHDCQSSAEGIGDHQRCGSREPEQVSAGHGQHHLAEFRGGRDREIQQQ